MSRFVALYRLPDDPARLAKFDDDYEHTHLPLVAKTPGLTRIEASKVQPHGVRRTGPAPDGGHAFRRRGRTQERPGQQGVGRLGAEPRGDRRSRPRHDVHPRRAPDRTRSRPEGPTPRSPPPAPEPSQGDNREGSPTRVGTRRARHRRRRRARHRRSARGPDPDQRRRGLPQRPALHAGQVRDPDADRRRSRSGGCGARGGQRCVLRQAGDHVVTCLSVFCGTCEYCFSGQLVLCSKRGTRRGRGEKQRLRRGDSDISQFLDVSAFAERMLVHENAVAAVDPELPLDRAALLGCGVTTGLGAVFRTARIRPGSTVAVIGCGGVGLNVIQGALDRRRRPGHRDRPGGGQARTGQDLRRDRRIDASTADAVESVRELTGAERASTTRSRPSG